MNILWSLILFILVVAVALTALKMVLLVLAIPFMLLRAPIVWLILIILGIIWLTNRKDKNQ